MKKLITSAAAVLLAAALCLTSCGDDDSSSECEELSSVSSAVSEAESSADESQSEQSGTGREDDSSQAAIAADTSVADSQAEPESSAPIEESAPDESSQAEVPVSSDTGLVGKWELKEMESGGNVYKDEVLGLPIAILFQFEFKDDGTVEMMQSEYGQDIKRATMGWKPKENGLWLLNANGDETVSFTLENGLLGGSLGTTYIRLIKVDEFTEYDPSSAAQEDDSTPASDLDTEDVVGKWELEEMRSGAMTLKGTYLETPVAVMIQLEFDSDGSGRIKRNEFGKEESQNIQWWMDDNTLKVRFEDDTPDDITDFQLKNDLLTASMIDSGQTLTVKLKKVDQFTEFDFTEFNQKYN